jgi:hypothetical protein
VRHEIHNIILWVDFVCINQEDQSEQGLQVSFMAGIYQGADFVIIWLGEGHPRNRMDEVFNFRDIYTLISLEDHGMVATTVVCSLLFAPTLHHINEATTLQECLVPVRTPRIRLGSLEWIWHDFDAELKQKYPGQHNFLSSKDAFFQLFLIYELRRSRERQGGSSKQSLRARLLQTVQHKCTDPRDRVYALLALTHDADHGTLAPDYAKPVQQLYQEVTAQLMHGDWDPSEDVTPVRTGVWIRDRNSMPFLPSKNLDIWFSM